VRDVAKTALRLSLARGTTRGGRRVDPISVVEQAWGGPRRQPSLPLKLAPALAFFAASAVEMARFGVPQKPDRLLPWLTMSLVCVCAVDPARVRRLVFEWCPLVGLIFAYDLARGSAATLWAHAHVLPQIWISSRLGRGTVPVVWLQRELWHGAAHIRWYDYAGFALYMSHFFATPLLAAVLWLTRKRAFRIYAGSVVALGFLGVATYAVFPAAPPWMASQDHYLPPVVHIIPAVSAHVPFLDYGPMFEQGERYANLVAAVPSLHAAYAMLIALLLGSMTRRRSVELALLLYPLAMGFALVYTGEHYSLDVVLGWLYAYAAFRLVSHYGACVESAHADGPRDHRRRLPRRW
jgi:membrane-associated phospholipid phosphatase